jgi:hypothetical protein
MQLPPLLQHVWEGRGRNGGTVISIFSPLLFNPLSKNPIQLILKIMKYIAFLQYFNKI